jgi:hypothetical protein
MSGGCSFTQEASALAKHKRTTILANLKPMKSEIRASINDCISGLHLDPAAQAAGNYIADGRCRFN